ncbi:hypothetical protein C4D60_Mb06t07170 [Musa balbisiana]|uniref:Uncharacterized protein n=1 Tax=Musa balbisiana TaxID=52838 RepID=A0A4S8INP5_MUSBA|nr:hypothetical protein C4D60_Mb06t07170 [Musa balbisiana]
MTRFNRELRWVGVELLTLAVHVLQSSTGKTVNGKPESDEVVISNRCICSQSSLKLSCPGFNTVEAVDSKLFRTDGGDLCAVNDNQPVYKDQSIEFKYAWDSRCALSPSASKVNCS